MQNKMLLWENKSILLSCDAGALQQSFAGVDGGAARASNVAVDFLQPQLSG